MCGSGRCILSSGVIAMVLAEVFPDSKPPTSTWVLMVGDYGADWA